MREDRKGLSQRIEKYSLNYILRGLCVLSSFAFLAVSIYALPIAYTTGYRYNGCIFRDGRWNMFSHHEQEILTWERLLLLNKFAVEEIYTKLRILNEEFSHQQRNNPIEHIKTRVKKKRSIIRKLVSRGIEPTPENAHDQLMDIAGVRMICSFTSDIYTLVEALKRQDDLKILQVKDYIENPKGNGYQSLHMLVEVPVFLANGSKPMCVEIQIRTIAMDFWASLEHKLYYKYDNDVPVHISDELKECALIINDLDSRMLNIKFQIDHYDKAYEEET